MHTPHAPSALGTARVLEILRQGAQALRQAAPFHRLDVLALAWEHGRGAWADSNTNPMADHSAHQRLQRLDALQPILKAWENMAEGLHRTPTLGPLIGSGGTPLLRLLRNANGFSLHLGAFGMRSAQQPWQEDALRGPWHIGVQAILDPLGHALRLVPGPARTLRFSEGTTGGVVGVGDVPTNVVEALWPAFTRPAMTTSNGRTIDYPMVAWERYTGTADACDADLCECTIVGPTHTTPSAHDATVRLDLRRGTKKGEENRAILAQLLALQQVSWGTQFCWIPAPGTDTARLMPPSY